MKFQEIKNYFKKTQNPRHNVDNINILNVLYLVLTRYKRRAQRILWLFNTLLYSMVNFNYKLKYTRGVHFNRN